MDSKCNLKLIMNMKLTKWIFPIAAVCMVTAAGCKKAEQAPAQAGGYVEYNGVKVEWPKLNVDFGRTDPTVQAMVSQATRSFRYGQLPQALAELNQLSNNPQLTSSQKQIVNDLIEQTKQALANASSHTGNK